MTKQLTILILALPFNSFSQALFHTSYNQTELYDIKGSDYVKKDVTGTDGLVWKTYFDNDKQIIIISDSVNKAYAEYQIVRMSVDKGHYIYTTKNKDKEWLLDFYQEDNWSVLDCFVDDRIIRYTRNLNKH